MEESTYYKPHFWSSSRSSRGSSSPASINLDEIACSEDSFFLSRLGNYVEASPRYGRTLYPRKPSP